MVSYAVRVVIDGIWSTVRDNARRWGKALVIATAALVTLIVSDNILTFVHGPYYLPTTYGGFAVVILIFWLSRKTKWGQSFRKLTLETAAWIAGVIAIVLLPFAEKDVYFFDTGHLLSYYNLLVGFAGFLLILLVLPFFVLSDILRNAPILLKAARQKRVPTIFNPDYIVQQKRSLFDRIVALLQD